MRSRPSPSAATNASSSRRVYMCRHFLDFHQPLTYETYAAASYRVDDRGGGARRSSNPIGFCCNNNSRRLLTFELIAWGFDRRRPHLPLRPMTQEFGIVIAGVSARRQFAVLCEFGEDVS